MQKPIITKRSNGEYSTVRLPDGIIETVWFPHDDGEPTRVVGRTYPQSIAGVAEKHITNWEGNH